MDSFRQKQHYTRIHDAFEAHYYDATSMAYRWCFLDGSQHPCRYPPTLLGCKPVPTPFNWNVIPAAVYPLIGGSAGRLAAPRALRLK
jgi:hypothetical protein